MRLLLEPEPDTELDALTAQAQAAHAAGLDGIMLRQTRAVPVPLIVDSVGRAEPSFHDHVFRYQAVGSTCTVASSGPAFVTRTVISRSSGPALA